MEKPDIDLTFKKPQNKCSLRKRSEMRRKKSLGSMKRSKKDPELIQFDFQSPLKNAKKKSLESINRKNLNEMKKSLGSMKRFQTKKSGSPFNEMKKSLGSMKRFQTKKSGTPFNEMKKSLGSMKRKKNIFENEDEENSNEEYFDEDYDFSKTWSDYDTWGYDKRSNL